MPPSGSKPKSPERLAAEAFGRRGEDLAAWFLRGKLYRIRDKRFKTPVGEIDLVAERLGVTVFVEVKSRGANEGERTALDAVNRQRIVRAAEFYLARHPALVNRTLRFDVIFLAPFTWPRHVVNTFDASGL
jgi:putative endonuclease